jgi:hypothetical protein
MFVSSISFSQVEIDSAETAKLQGFQFGGLYRSAISANAGGVSGLVGITYDLLLSKHWNFEIGGGYPGAGFGFTYYPIEVERSKARFHISQRNAIVGQAFGRPTRMQYALCFGLTQFGTRKWNWGLDVGPMYEHTLDSFDFIAPENGPIGFMFNLKAGYRFSFKAWKRARELNSK